MTTKTKTDAPRTWTLTDDHYSAIPIQFDSPDDFVAYVLEMQAMEPLAGWTIPENPEEHGEWIGR